MLLVRTVLNRTDLNTALFVHSQSSHLQRQHSFLMLLCNISVSFSCIQCCMKSSLVTSVAGKDREQFHYQRKFC